MKVHLTIQRGLEMTDEALIGVIILGPFLCLGILAIIILLSLGVVFMVWRCLIVGAAKVFKRGSLGAPVPIKSAPYRSGDPMYKATTASVLVYVVLEGRVDIAQFKKVLRERLFQKVDPKSGKRFYKEATRNMSLWCGYPFWREVPGLNMDPTDEDLDKYVSFYKNDPNLKTDFPTLKSFMDTLMFQPYSRRGPLFDIILFPNYTPDSHVNNAVPPGGEYFAAVWHFHHGLCDGFACMKMLEALSINTPKMEILRGGNYTHGERMSKVPMWTAILETLKVGPKFIFETATLIYWQFTNSVGRGIWEWEGVKGMNSSEVVLSNRDIQEKRVRALRTNFGTTIPLSVLSDIKKAYGGKVSGSAVLFAALVGAVRRTMFTKEWAIPKYLGVSFPLPLPGHVGKFKNQMTGMKVFLPLSEPNAGKRVFESDRILQGVKRSTLPMFASFFHLVIGVMPRWFYKIIPWIVGHERALTASNLPGPKETFDMAGWPVRDIGWSAGASVTLNVFFMSIFTFGGHLRPGFMGPGGLFDHQYDLEGKIIDNFFKELEAIRASGPDFVCQGVVSTKV